MLSALAVRQLVGVAVVPVPIALSIVGSEKVLGEDSGVRWVVAISGPDNQCVVCVYSPQN